MSKITLSLEEIYTLDVEIGGAKNPQTGEQEFTGLLNQELSLVTKFKLSDTKDRIGSHKKNVDTLREELIKKLGKEDKESGQINLPMVINKLDAKGKLVKDEEGKLIKEMNPNFIEFNNKFNELLSETVEVDLPDFKIQEFDIKTSEKYDVFFKLLKK
jgi:hypothetical protein